VNPPTAPIPPEVAALLASPQADGPLLLAACFCIAFLAAAAMCAVADGLAWIERRWKR
jgi:hypothetical protein